MTTKSDPGITIQLTEIAKLLCPKCQQKLKRLVMEKLAEKIMVG